MQRAKDESVVRGHGSGSAEGLPKRVRNCKSGLTGYFILFLGLLTIMSACRHAILGEDNAREALARALADTTDNFSSRKLELIPDKETATKFAEVILFKTFGEDKIKDERPYEIYKIDGYWILSGTIPVGYDGGGFEIIFQSNDGKVISLKHYR